MLNVFNLYVDSVAQIVQFMNEAFVPFDSHHDAVYGLQQWTTKDIDRSVSLYTDSFDSKSLKDFTTWCGQKKLHFFKAKVRKRQTSVKVTVSNQRRFSHIMKQHFLCDIELPASQKQLLNSFHFFFIGKAISTIIVYASSYKSGGFFFLKKSLEEGFEWI